MSAHCCPRQASCFKASCASAGQAAQLSDHEVHDVVGDSPWRGCAPDPRSSAASSGSNASSPSSASAVRNWIAKNGLPPVFSCTSSASGARALAVAVQRVGDELRQRRRARAAPARSPAPCAPALRIASSVAHQRMRGTDLVVAVGADQQQVPHLRLGDQIARAGRASPRPAIADRRGTARADAPAARTRRGIAGTPAGSGSCASCGGSSGTGGCSPMMSCELRDQVDHELAVRAQRLQQRAAPAAQLRLALAEQLPDEALERLRQRRIGDVALVLVELAGGEEAARRHQHLVQLVDDRGLADAGIARHQHQLRSRRWRRPDRTLRAARRSRRSRPYSFSGISSRSDASCAPSGNGSMRPLRLPCRQAAPKIGLDAGGGLVALLGGLGEQLHDDGRDRRRDAVDPLARAASAAARCGSGPTPCGSAAVNGSAPVSIS